MYRGAGKSFARSGRKQATATGDFDVHISYLLSLIGEILLFYIYIYIYRVSQDEWTKLRESVPYAELHRYNPKHLYPKLNGYGDNGQRSLKL